jgi:hypothetical protein
MYSSYSFLTSSLDGRERSASRTSSALSRERTTGTHWVGGWVGLRAGLYKEARQKIFSLFRGSNAGRPACGQTLYWPSGIYAVKTRKSVQHRTLWRSLDLHFEQLHNCTRMISYPVKSWSHFCLFTLSFGFVTTYEYPLPTGVAYRRFNTYFL